jgi:hypothetical protein
MEFLLGHAVGRQMPTLDILKVGSEIDDVTDTQPIAKVGKNRRIWYRQ